MASHANLKTAAFGRTGHESSRVLFGAAAIGGVGQDVADELLELLIEFGVNHIDTAASYGDSELRIAPWLARHPDRFFLATKTGERDGDAARTELERSLTRLGVDHVDLIQLHNLVEPEEWEQAHAPNGALAALLRARDEGLVRFIGVTGHGLRIPTMHLRSLDRFDYDSVLLPCNHALLADPAYRSAFEELSARCAERNVAVVTIKSIAKRRWTAEGPHRSWYEPLEDAGAITRAVHYVLARPQLFLSSSSDYLRLRTVLEAAAQPPTPPTDAELDADADTFEISPIFDGGALERI